MKKLSSIALTLAIAIPIYSQTFYGTTDSLYQKLVDQAFEHLQKGECRPCLDKYEEAFKISQRSILSRLRAASCAFACNDEVQMKAHAQFALDKEWGTVDNIMQDLNKQYPELTKYRGSSFYTYVQDQLQPIKRSAGYDATLAAELEVIYKDDQDLRQGATNSAIESGKKSRWEEIHRLDSINVLKIERIFLKYGYPGKSKVGGSLASTAFLVIQHADLAYQEKYLPLIAEAANKGELDKGSLALLIDRIRMRKGQKQLYGSQVVDADHDGKWELHPIEDEENVNKRRETMGLGTIEAYAKRFDIEYKPTKKD